MKNLLKSKDLTPLEKLFILDIQANSILFPYRKTSAEIAKDLGTTRKTILSMIENLQLKGYIITTVSAPIRTTKLTQKTIIIIND